MLGAPTVVEDGTAPAELRRLAGLFDGGRLFHARYPQPNSEFGDWESTAVHVLPLGDIITQTRRFRTKHQSDGWLRQLTVIGSNDGGDLFVADTHDDAPGDWPVHYLDHEYFIGGSYEPEALQPIASSVLGFVQRVATDPLPFLSGWRHLDDNGEQYYVDAVEFVDE
ncbi:MAG: hypothetical protein ABI586_07665 [Candidatus Nanopelagicales bacterium]